MRSWLVTGASDYDPSGIAIMDTGGSLSAMDAAGNRLFSEIHGFF